MILSIRPKTSLKVFSSSCDQVSGGDKDPSRPCLQSDLYTGPWTFGTGIAQFNDTP